MEHSANTSPVMHDVTTVNYVEKEMTLWVWSMKNTGFRVTALSFVKWSNTS